MIEEDINRRVLEPEIKSMVLNFLISNGFISSLDTVFNEFTVDGASRRVDLAITKGKELWGFEIKSEADSLTRLKGQIDIYSQFFDKVFVVVASKHVGAVLSMIPTSVALWEIQRNKIIVKQKGRKKLIKNPNSFIDMMSVSDLSKVVNRIGIKSQSKRRQDLISCLSKVNHSLLRDAAFKALTQRYQLSSKMFFDQVIGRKITPNDINLLSRFKLHNMKPTIIPDSVDDIVHALNAIGLDDNLDDFEPPKLC
ncbi:sce7726 family protein [Shewanella sp. A14]